MTASIEDGIYVAVSDIVKTQDGHEFKVSARVGSLLYRSDQRVDPARLSNGMTFRIEYNSGTQNVRVSGPSAEFKFGHEPSTIYLSLPVRQPPSTHNVAPLGYCPVYARLQPEQRWTYLNWLQDPTKPIDAGYVFLYYYGLERQLVVGDFDQASEEICLLRHYQGNSPFMRSYSFMNYTTSALFHGSHLRGRTDVAVRFLSSQAVESGSDAVLLSKCLAGIGLSPGEVFRISGYLTNINRRYEKLRPDLFERMIGQAIRNRYGTTSFHIEKLFDLTKFPRDVHAFANESFPDELRRSILPSFLSFEPFIDELKAVWSDAHELTKGAIQRGL